METKQIQVGTPITYKGDMANASGNGAVVNVRTNDLKGAMFSMNFKEGTLQQIDTSKSFDILLDDGRQFNGVYSANIGGDASNYSCRFMVGQGEPLDAAGIAKLVADNATAKAAIKAKADEVAALFEKAKLAAKDQGEKLGLMTEADFNKAGKKGTAAAYNLRLELKAKGFKVASLTGDYNSINIKLKPETLARLARAFSFILVPCCATAFAKSFSGGLAKRNV